jgi:phospholipid/cholesterol/gamma-HCH transport system permease protein
MDLADDPTFTSERSGDAVRLRLSGRWTLDASAALETEAKALFTGAGAARKAVLDLRNVSRLDTAGAWLIDKTRQDLAAQGVDASFESISPEYGLLLHEAGYRVFHAPRRRQDSYLLTMLADVGESVVEAGRDFLEAIEFLGEVVASIAKSAIYPRSFRGVSLVSQMETIGVRSVPIIALINFLVGAIIAQQGIFQLRRFGAVILAVDLVSVLVLRELGVLMTSIMIAGRSGSAITAEIGSMKMREEIDALHVMGLRPIEVLVVPRILALIFSVPLLTFIADMSAIAGGILVSWIYGGITPTSFIALIPEAIGVNTFMVGMIKAPFMGLVIGLISCVEGFAVEGSAESLGRRVTASVIKAIFMVVVVDGLFGAFFAGIRY